MVTYSDIRHNPEVRALIEAGNAALGVLGYTDHGYAHAGLTAQVAGEILTALGYSERECELARIAGYMHDIGNVVNRADHAQSGAIMAFQLLTGMGMPAKEIGYVVSAIGHHDEGTAFPVNAIAAAVILADKSDVRRSRVRTRLEAKNFDIHDRVNYAVVDSSLKVHREEGLITLALQIDTTITAVMDYFEIFLSRMTLCRDAAAFLQQNFELVINETRML